jgi:hypothetical protein
MGATERPLCPRKRTNQQSLQDVPLGGKSGLTHRSKKWMR